MSRQLAFDLPHRPAMGLRDFYVSQANASAVRDIEGWREWPHAKMILVGPEGSGKTHLTHVWEGLSGAQICAAETLAQNAEHMSQATALALEDADRIAGDRAAETALFHVHNALALRQAPLLITARARPSRWGLELPDLASRMAQAAQTHLDPPDDHLFAAVVVKLADDRQMRLTPTILAYVIPRLERSFGAAQRFVASLDARALADQRPPTRGMAKKVLAELDL